MSSSDLNLETVYETHLSPLHFEIEQFAADVVPTLQERRVFEDLASVMDQVTAETVGRRARVKPFGSFAMGLSSHDADLDLVVCNVIKVTSGGYRVEQKARAIKILYAIAKKLAYSNMLKLSQMKVIAQTKIPVLKITTSDRARIDLTVHNRSGIDAAAFMRETLKDYPTIVPVILVLKCLLKQSGLNDVSLGGLGGYALTNMALMHCKALRAMGRPDIDAGQVLIGFLELFGRRFDLFRQAVSSRHGAIVKKKELERETLEWIRNTEGWQGRTNNRPLLFIEDPMTGRNLAVSTTRFSEIQRTFRKAHDRLVHCRLEDDLLSEIIDVEDAVRRRRKKTRRLPVERYEKNKRLEKRTTIKRQPQNGRMRSKKRHGMSDGVRMTAHRSSIGRWSCL